MNRYSYSIPPFILVIIISLISCSKTNDKPAPEPVKNDAIVTTLAGSGKYGMANGKGQDATFGYPDAICTDAAGNIYVGSGGDTAIRKITPDGVVSGVPNKTPGNQMGGIWGLTITPSGIFYFTFTLGHVLYKLPPGGGLTFVAGSDLGDQDGLGNAAKFSDLIGLASDASGNVYGADFENFKIRKITPTGLVSTVPGTGVYTAPGISSSNFLSLQSIAVDKIGNFYVTDPNQYAVIKLDPAGKAKRLASLMKYPAGIAIDNSGNVYVSDMTDHIINKIATDGTITLIAGTGKRGYKDGKGNEASFNLPQSLALDPSGKILYVADAGNNMIRKIILP